MSADNDVQPCSRGMRLATMRWCRDCDEYVLRSRVQPDHTTFAVAPRDKRAYQALPEFSPVRYDGADLPWETRSDVDDGDDDDTRRDDAAIEGYEYEVRKEVSLTVTGTVVAPTRDEAKRQVTRHLSDDGVVTDAHTMHTDVTEVEPIYLDDERSDEL